MMNEIGSLCKAVAVVSVVSGVITALLPKSKLTYSVNTLSSIIILYTFLLPFNNFNSDVKIITENFNSEYTSDISNAATDILIELSEKELKKSIEKILSDNGLKGICEVELIYKENENIKEKIIIKGNYNLNEKEIIKTAIETELERSVYIEFSE